VNVQTCPRCGTTAPLQFVACPKCRALFHADQLTALSAEADQLEAKGDLHGALERLRLMEPLLPTSSTQATALRQRIAALEPKAGLAPRAPSNRKGGWAAGGIGAALLALLTKGKFLLLGLTKLPTLMSFFLSAALWRGDGAGSSAVPLVLLGSIYVHEMGHTFAFRRYGIAVTAPMFVPGFGAFVRGSHYPKSHAAIGDVALSGPLWGGVTGVLVLALGLALNLTWLQGAALVIAEINLFNLLPVWQLDGNRATACLSRSQVTTLGLVGVIGAALAVSPVGFVSSAGLLARRWLSPPVNEPGDARTYKLFFGLLVGLLVLAATKHLLSLSV
jgi:Zn-dependent protease